MKEFLSNTWKNRAYVVMALPVFLIMLFINYIPMTGLVLAFEKFDYTKGIFGSPLIGLDNFKFLLQSKDVFYRMLKNTLMYYVIFTALGQFLNVVLAIAIDERAHRGTAAHLEGQEPPAAWNNEQHIAFRAEAQIRNLQPRKRKHNSRVSHHHPRTDARRQSDLRQEIHRRLLEVP